MQEENGEIPTSQSLPDGNRVSGSFVRDTLVGWGLTEYVSNFEHEKIDESSFFQLPDNAVARLIPRMGPYYKFLFERQKLETPATLQEVPPTRTFLESGQTLYMLLRRTKKGRYLLAQKRLKDESTLCNIVVDHLMDKSFKVTREEYMFWADEIVTTFPKQKQQIWYKPSKKGTAASGKLYDKFNNVKKKIKPAVTEYEKKRAECRSTAGSERDAQYLQELQMTSLDDLQKIKDLWQKTFNTRDISDSISAYYNRYPQLRTPLGSELIQLDYERLDYVPKDEPLKTKWLELANKILCLARRKTVCTEILENADDTPPEIVALRVLPFLIRTTNVKTNVKKKQWKPSQKEQANGFIIWINTITEFENILTTQRDLLKKYNLTLQPFVVAVGPPSQLTAAYVVIDDIKYKFGTLLEAVDLCFKSFYALNAAYPVSSEPVWVFLQTEVYGIEEKDKYYQSVQSLRTKLADEEDQADLDTDSATEFD